MVASNETDRTEFLWVELNEAAAAQLRVGKFVMAAQKWQRAFDIAQQFEENDPRVASSLNNLAIAHRLGCNFAQAEQYYQHAIAAWQKASSWVDQMYLSPRARSSLFHMRMERKHKQGYRRIAIKKYQALLPAGRAATHNNLAELYVAIDREEDARPIYVQALRDRSEAVGADDPTTAIIRDNAKTLGLQTADGSGVQPPYRIKDAGPFSAQATAKRWIIDKPAEFTDEGRLMAAILLTPVLDHGRLVSLS